MEMTIRQDKTDSSHLLRVLTLDGGGAKGFYTLGVLKEIEAMSQCPLHRKFDLIFGTSTGAIIASLIALDNSVDTILDLYRKHVPVVMSHKTARGRSEAMKTLASEVFGNATFSDVKTGIGVVTAKWLTEQPMIFKGNVAQAHGRVDTFVPGFGVSIADAIKASCSAYLEGLLYNVPNEKLTSSYQDCIINTLNWYRKEAKKADLVCANEQYYLLRDNCHTCWPQVSCDAFVDATVRLWNEWGSQT
jgi:predicted acylesterase/phospholipase RssA